MSGILHAKVESATGKDMADWTQAKYVGDKLNEHYRGWMWMVNYDSNGGIATVKSALLNGRFGFLLKLPATYSASEWDRRIMLAGGEFLERHGAKRGPFNQSEYDKLKRVDGQHVVSL